MVTCRKFLESAKVVGGSAALGKTQVIRWAGKPTGELMADYMLRETRRAAAGVSGSVKIWPGPTSRRERVRRRRCLETTFDYRELPMQATGKGDEYQAIIPAEHIDPKWNFMYLIEVMDAHGNGRIYPDLERKTPCVVIKLKQ